MDAMDLAADRTVDPFINHSSHPMFAQKRQESYTLLAWSWVKTASRRARLKNSN